MARGVENARITNDTTAILAVEMMEYMSTYYVPGSGYRGPSAVETELRRQRRESIELVAASLERYTGLNYGTDLKRWSDWARKQETGE